MDGAKGRRLGEPDNDVRENVDWMTRYPDEAWQHLERRVARIEPILRAHHRELANFLPLHQAYQAQLDQLRASVRQAHVRQQQLHEDITHIKLSGNMTMAAVDGVRKDYAQMNAEVNTIRHQVNTGLEATSRDINQLKTKINTVSQSLKGMGEKTDGKAKELKKYIDTKTIQCQEIAKINENLIKGHESRIAQLREKMLELNNKNQRDMDGLGVGIKQVTTKLQRVAGDTAKNKEGITNNAVKFRKQISQMKQNSQKLKNDILAKIDNLKSK